MSTQAPRQAATQFKPKLTAEMKTAIVSRVAAGEAQDVVATAFSIHPATVSRIITTARKNDANGPLARDWKKDHAELFIRTVDRLDEVKEPAKAVALALTGLEKLGLIGRAEGAAVKVDVWLASPGAQAAAARVAATVTTTGCGPVPTGGAPDAGSVT